MDIQINKTYNISGIKGIEAVCGKVTAEVTVTRSQIIVLCKNASNRAWGGIGRAFESFEAAKAGYKSSAMKSIIEHAQATL